MFLRILLLTKFAFDFDNIQFLRLIIFIIDLMRQLNSFSNPDGQIDCGPEAEDEDDCEITEDMVKKMKTECESNTMSRHVMCPNTYICIKQDWLCGELNLFSVVQDFERLSLQTATMTATTLPTKLTAERRPIAPTTNSNASTVSACRRSGCAVRAKLSTSPMYRFIDLAFFRRRQRLQGQLRRGQLHPIVSRRVEVAVSIHHRRVGFAARPRRKEKK